MFNTIDFQDTSRYNNNIDESEQTFKLCFEDYY